MSVDPAEPAAVSASPLAALSAAISGAFPSDITAVPSSTGEVTFEVADERLLEVALVLRDRFKFEMCVDLCGIDYMNFGEDEWKTRSATISGFSRGVNRAALRQDSAAPNRRFATVYHLLSLTHNQRLRLRAFCPDDGQPMLDSVTGVWAGTNWFEREAFDLYGILFRGHPDLRRLLTDYGFIGHPFRKDFPLIGNVEVRYDPEKRRVIYQPVTIESRTLVPKVIRHDHRYDPQLTNAPVGDFRSVKDDG